MSTLLNRLPERRETGYAYGGIVFLIYSWALRGFFYQVSSLILYHSIGDILSILAYMMALALLESLAVMAVFLVLSLVLPREWFREGFGYKAFLAVLVSAAGAIALESYLTRRIPETFYLYAGFASGLVLLLGSIWLFERQSSLRRLLVGLLDRLTIFLYLYIPIGILSLFVVFLRNLT